MSVQEKPPIVRKLNSDEIDRMKLQLAKLQSSFQSLKKSGLHPEILEIYLNHKTGVNMIDVRNVLYHQEEFFKRLQNLRD